MNANTTLYSNHGRASPSESKVHRTVKFWYLGLNRLQQGAVIIGLLALIYVLIVWITRDLNRPVRDRIPHIILNCDTCGVDPEKQISMQNYVKNKLHEQQSTYQQERQRLRQQQWDENGRTRWCRSHPNDHACKNFTNKGKQ